MYKIETRFPLVGCVESRIGGRSENQDAYGYVDTPLGALIVVCDGMGGANGGSTASNLAVKVILENVAAATENPENALKNAILNANEAIYRMGQEYPDLYGMGTTVTAVLINTCCAYSAHVGDSRVYQLRGKRKVYRTFDDSAVFQLVKMKTITEEQARTSSNSNVILKALGVSETLDFDVDKLSYDKGDRFVLCTDGFWGNVPESEFIDYISKKGSLETVVERAAGKVEKAGIQLKGGGHDNLTAAVFNTLNYSKFRTKMEKFFKMISAVLAVLLIACVVVIFNLNSKINKLKASDSANDVENVFLPQEETVDSTCVAPIVLGES